MIKKTQSTYIDGPVGCLEARIGRKPRQADLAGLVVLTHPHPQFGGTMNNKVVTTMERAFADSGWQTLAFNFRGAGHSEGEYDGGRGEQQDLATVVDWARVVWGDVPLTLAGFSFGAYVSLMQAQALAPQRIISVAPPVGLYDFSQVPDDLGCDWLLVQGGQDEVVEAAEVLDWLRQLDNPPDLLWRQRASHYFHGELIWLRRALSALL